MAEVIRQEILFDITEGLILLNFVRRGTDVIRTIRIGAFLSKSCSVILKCPLS